MMDDDFWKAVREKEQASSKALNIALLFGTAAVALSLILTPMLSDKSKSSVLASAPEFDAITTGSIPKTENGKRYTIRRSVLQQEPGAVCVIQGYGDGGC